MKSLKFIFSGLSAVALSSGVMYAQNEPVVEPDSSNTVHDYKIEVYEKVNIPEKKPIPYAYVREGDVLWDKTVWRMVDLQEKQNLPLYYPTQKGIGSRLSLTELLLKGVDSGELTAFAADDPNNEFAKPLTKEQLDVNFGAKQDTIQVADADGNMISQARNVERQTDQVKLLLVKEHIYFDKKHSVFERRVIGLCPIRVFSRDGGNSEEEFTNDAPAQMQMTKTMWIYVPQARAIMARHPIYNRFNDAQSQSFDDYFMKHMYKGAIYQISNVYNNRAISEYTSGLDALYEADRIEQELFNWEQGLWQY